MINKKKYFDANIHGFFNLLEIFKKNKPKIFSLRHLVLFMEIATIILQMRKKYYSPKNMYSLSKKINEDLAQIYSSQYNMKLIGFKIFYCFWRMGKTRYVFV